MMKTEYTSVRNILINTISILCKNSLTYHQGLRVHGLLGITVDEDVFLVEISEQFSRKDETADTSTSPLKLPADETCIVEASYDCVAKLRRKGNRQRNLQESSYAVEEISEKSAAILSVESCIDSNFCSKSEASANNDVVFVKKERTTDDDDDDGNDLRLLAENVKVLPLETSLLHHQLTSDDLGFSEATCFADSSFKIKAGNMAAVSVDNANPSSAGVDWNQTAFVNQNWLESTQSCSHGHSPSQVKLRAKKSNLHKFSTSSESRPLLSDSFSGHRYLQLRRSSVSVHKQFSCDIEGCTRSYYAKKNLLRHQTTMHGRVPAYRRPRMLSFFYQGT